jgi:hypothetical protein
MSSGAADKYQNVCFGSVCPKNVASLGSMAATSSPFLWLSSRLVTANACLLCGIPHNRHYVDGGVMCPVGVSLLVGAAPVAFSSA